MYLSEGWTIKEFQRRFRRDDVDVVEDEGVGVGVGVGWLEDVDVEGEV